MAYVDLTTEQQNSLQAWLAILRAAGGELARLNNHGSVLATEYAAVTSAILGELADGDIIPNVSGLAGAESLTKLEITTLIGYMQTAQSLDTATHRQLIAKAAGEANLIG